MRLPTVLCLLLVAACTSNGGTAAPTASPSTPSPTSAAPSPSSSPAPGPPSLVAAVPRGAVVLAAATASGALRLFTLAPGSSAAVPLRTLVGPAHGTVEGVSLSGESGPTVCAVWRPAAGDPEASFELRCYPPGATAGRVVRSDVGLDIGLRADGRAIAWTEGNQELVVADLARGVATVRTRMRYAPDAPEGGYPEALGDLDWIGPRTLVGTSVGDSDESAGLCVIDLDHPRQGHRGAGFGRCLHPLGPEAHAGYAHFEQAALVAPGEAVVVERAMGCCFDDEPRPAGRAVRLRLSDGAVLSVFATARPGRDVVDISGGARAVLYTTSAEGKDPIVSVRWAGQAHGSPVTGLPADTVIAVAQP